MFVIFKYFQQTEGDKIAQELLSEFVPFNSLEKYYKYGQASIVASLLNWLHQNQEHFESDIEKDFYKSFEEALKQMYHDDKSVENMIDRLLKDLNS